MQRTVSAIVIAIRFSWCNFLILIPVLSDLDELKKHSDGARNAIKWLEYEFSKGNRFLRTQKSHEMLPMPLFKIPKKMGKLLIQFVNNFPINFIQILFCLQIAMQPSSVR